ncbi:MAG: DUF5665 domain-containing protein [Paracoccaceae bacterium]|nr:DUF5665 domain-containing protein [Paracoccaceae bacterium]
MALDGKTEQELAALRVELERLNAHRFIRLHNSTVRMIWLQFLRGLAFGLGTVMGASILVSMIALALSQIEFLPIIGEWAAEIRRQMEAAQ